METAEYGVVCSELAKIKARLDVLEANSRKACSEQPLVGPPEKSEERPAALARPQTIAELVSFVEKEFQLYIDFAKTDDEVQFMSSLKRSILQRLGKLDRGPIAKPLSEKEIQERRWNTFKSPYGQ